MAGATAIEHRKEVNRKKQEILLHRRKQIYRDDRTSQSESSGQKEAISKSYSSLKERKTQFGSF